MSEKPKKGTIKRRPLHAHLVRHGPMTRDNPELIRIAEATDYSADHVYKIAIGQRDAQQRTARAISEAVAASATPADPPVTPASLMAAPKSKARRAARSA